MANIKGAIFDVDDTLLDNQVGIGTLHEYSRLRATLQAAENHDLAALKSITAQENTEAFLNAKTHSIDGAVWVVLFQKGLVDTDELDPEHPLLKEIVKLKNEIHADILRQHGRPVVGAIDLVHTLAEKYKLTDKLAIASSAVRRDIDIFLDEMTDLRQFLPANRIVAYEDIPHGLGKPHPEPFDRAFKMLGLLDSDRRNVLAFEDDPRGIQSARAAGLYVCAITTRYKADHPALIASKPDMVIDNYDDFIKELAN